MALAPGTSLGPYKILERVGTGGMGEVYRATDSRLNRDVAVKISAVAFGDRFQREARAIAALNHPNICTIHDVGPDYLVMELVPGETLADRLRAGHLPIAEAVAVATQIAEALEAAHDKGIIHRDLKPGNIKIKPDGSVKVLDFGLAKTVASGDAISNSPTFTDGASEAGLIMGTAAYMSPEQARGKDVDKRTDIWAFGCLLYQMLAGKPAFDGETVTDVLAAVMKNEPDWSALPSDTPTMLRLVLRRCLQKDPAQRVHDMGDARLEIQEATTEPGVEFLRDDEIQASMDCRHAVGSRGAVRGRRGVAGGGPAWRKRSVQPGAGPPRLEPAGGLGALLEHDVCGVFAQWLRRGAGRHRRG